MLPAWAWCWLAAASVVGFAAAAADKRRARARQGRGRVPEAAFHALALLGGWPGALLAFAIFRHKTRKPRFLAPFLLCALLNAAIAAFAWDRLAGFPG